MKKLTTLILILISTLSFSQEQNDTIKIKIFKNQGLIDEIVFNSVNIKDTVPLFLGEGLFYIRCNKTSNLYINNIFTLNIFNLNLNDSIYLITVNNIRNE